MSMSGSESGPESESESADPTTGGPPASSCADDPALVLCFDFESVDGGMLEDGSMYGHDATAAAAEIASGPWGMGLMADAELRVEVPCFENCETTGELTLEARVRIDEVPPAGSRSGIIDNDMEYAITYSDAGVRCSNGPGNVVLGPTLPVGEWVHVACVNDGDMLRMYVDGVDEARSAIGGAGPTGDGDPVAIANTSPNWDEPLVGAIDSVRVWMRARTPQEIEDTV